MFRSPALNALVERALRNNPSLQQAIATLRASKETVYAQQGHYFPLVQANFIPERQQSAAALSAPLATGVAPQTFSLYTAQVLVSYNFDVWGLNRRTVESAPGLGR